MGTRSALRDSTVPGPGEAGQECFARVLFWRRMVTLFASWAWLKCLRYIRGTKHWAWLGRRGIGTTVRSFILNRTSCTRLRSYTTRSWWISQSFTIRASMITALIFIAFASPCYLLRSRTAVALALSHCGPIMWSAIRFCFRLIIHIRPGLEQSDSAAAFP
jgi:hypothetical protein